MLSRRRIVRAWHFVTLLACICCSCRRDRLPLVAAKTQGQEHKIITRIAVVGAGIGGSSASFFLRELMGNDTEIVVFDKNEKPGGRTDVSILPCSI